MYKTLSLYFVVFMCFLGTFLARASEQFDVVMTAYSSTVSQTDSTPFLTSTNQRVKLGIVAASRDLLAEKLPYGTQLRVVAINNTSKCGGQKPEIILEVQDTMNKRKRNQLDLWLPSTSKAREWGRCEVTVEILGETLMQAPNKSAVQTRVAEIPKTPLRNSDLFVEAARSVTINSFDFYGIDNASLTQANSVVPASNFSHNTNNNNLANSNLTQTHLETPNQQSLLGLASQAFLIPILHFAFSMPNASEEMLDYYAEYYMDKSLLKP